MKKKTDNKDMKVEGGDYFTVADMSQMIGIPIETVKTRLKNKGIKPLSRDALYTSSDFEKIKNTAMGRPKKEKPAPDKKPPTNKSKGKKQKK